MNGIVAATTVKSATRILDVLEMLAICAEPLGVSEASRRLGIPKSSMHMLFATLEERGYAVGDAERRFQLNPALSADGGAWVGGTRARVFHLARRPMEELARATRESSFLGVRRGEATIEYIGKMVTPQDLRCDAQLGLPRPVHSTSVGLVFLAWQPEQETERFLRRGRLDRVTDATVCDPRQIRLELAAIRRRGYAVVRDTNSPGASGAAAPIFDSEQRVVAALNVAAPTSRFESILDKAVTALLKATGAISKALNGTTATQISRRSSR